MKGKISLGYGGVEITDEGVMNIITKPCPLNTTEGYQFETPKDKLGQMKNLGKVVEFLQTTFYDQVYVKPVEAGYLGTWKDVKFLVGGEFLLHVQQVEDGSLLTTLAVEDGGDWSIIKFTYEGVLLNNFFNEIKKDITDIFEGHE